MTLPQFENVMMKIQENISLKPYNTFGIDAKARFFAAFESLTELEEIVSYKLQTTNRKLKQVLH